MKKLVISALCGLCLFGAFVTLGGQPANDEQVAISRLRIGTRI